MTVHTSTPNRRLKSSDVLPEQDILVTISTSGRKYSGRWYKGRNGLQDRITLFVNIIARDIDPDSPLFEKALAVMFLHEYIHIKHFRNGCKNGANCRAGSCFFCNQTYKILEHIV